jgi:hypothetical protein
MELLPSNHKWVHIQTHRLTGEIYEVCRSDGLRCHDIHTKFHNAIQKSTVAHRQHGYLISPHLFFVQNWKKKVNEVTEMCRPFS